MMPSRSIARAFHLSSVLTAQPIDAGKVGTVQYVAKAKSELHGLSMETTSLRTVTTHETY
jgi:hypothetical protein